MGLASLHFQALCLQWGLILLAAPNSLWPSPLTNAPLWLGQSCFLEEKRRLGTQLHGKWGHLVHQVMKMLWIQVDDSASLGLSFLFWKMGESHKHS